MTKDELIEAMTSVPGGAIIVLDIDHPNAGRYYPRLVEYSMQQQVFNKEVSKKDMGLLPSVHTVVIRGE